MHEAIIWEETSMAKLVRFMIALALLAALASPSRPVTAADGTAGPAVGDEPEAHFAELPEEPAVGGDYRVRRGYDYATINAKEDIHILYFLFDDGMLVFYRDEPSMGPLLSVDLSSSSDPESAKENLVFEDVDGDGYNDLRIPVSPGQWKTWRWNSEEWEFESVTP